jgi:hypothetical protein
MPRKDEIARIHVIDGYDCEEGVQADRRRVLKRIGVAILTMQCLPLVADAAENSPGGTNQSAENLIIHSGPGAFSHIHELLIPYAVLKVPPVQGVELTSSQALLHQHNVALTRDELLLVGKGGRVVKKASSHLFTIEVAKRA